MGAPPGLPLPLQVRDSEDREGAAPALPLFRHPWRFVTEAPHMAALPPEGPPEVAFAGRSNVGKSSLINALTRNSGSPARPTRRDARRR